MANDSFSFPSPLFLADSDIEYALQEEFDREEMTEEAGKQQKRYPFVVGIHDHQLDPPVTEFEIHSEISMNEQRMDPVVNDGIPLSMSPTLIKPQPSVAMSFGLLCNYRNVLKRHKQENPSKNIKEVIPVDQKRLSTVEIIRVAGERFIQLQQLRDDDLSVGMRPCGLSFSGLLEADKKDVELTVELLAGAEKVGDRQFDCAARFLAHCRTLSSKQGSPTQRIILCFAEVLHELIDKAMGKCEQKGMQEPSTSPCLETNRTWLHCYGRLPLTQITQFTSIQALVDNTATASRIHVIDLALRNGIHMIVLLQALSERKTNAVELLKITAVTTMMKEKVEESGRRLVSVAKTMGINSSFSVVFVDHMEDIDEDLFDIEDGEAVAIYTPMVLRTMISQQNSLEKLTTVLRNLNPSVMVVTEIEANHNSLSFMSRFIETLFFYGASFDCLETCMADDSKNRTLTEQYLRNEVKNILSMEDSERITRNVKIDVWRAFFKRYRMVEIGLSESSLYQARLVAQQFPCARFCTLKHDEKCLIIGWKGTPLLSVSAWKFR